MKYHIAYQDGDDAILSSFNSMEDLKRFMTSCNLQPDDVWLIEGGELISGIGNKHMPKEFFDDKRKRKNSKMPRMRKR